MNDQGATALAISTIEAEAFSAWPAAEVVPRGSWRLRATPGVTRRANSVWLGASDEGEEGDDGGDDDGDDDGARPREGITALAEAVGEVEAFYRARGLPPMFQVTPAAGAARLDAFLAARGYEHDDSVSVQVARASDVVARPPEQAQVACELTRAPSPAWFEISAHAGRYRDVAASYRALLERIGPRGCFALARDQGVPAAVGLLVEGTQASGLFAMQTLGAHRRRGLARAILGALAAEVLARREGDAAKAHEPLLYLQVERANAAALALYASCGFRERYGYHYRVRR